MRIRHRSLKLYVALALLLAADCLTSPVFAVPPGIPDSGFGIDGKQVIALNLGGDNFDDASDVAVQADGKVVVVGSARFGPTDTDFAAVRIDAEGNLDPSFGTNGATTVFFDLGPSLVDIPEAVAIQNDGKIVIAGWVDVGPTNNDDIAVVRLDADGLLDTTFDGDGKTTVALDLSPSNFDHATDLAIQPDGKILVAGHATDAGGSSSDCFVVRLLANGGLDTSFDGDGKALIPFNLGGNLHDGCTEVALQSDGKIIIAGYVETASGFQMGLARLTTTGALDNSFSADGRTTIDFGPGSTSSGNAIAIMQDGRIVVAGDANPDGTYDFAVARLTASGIPDSSFNSTGTQTLDFAAGGDDFDSATGVTVQADGKIALGGYVNRGFGNFDFAVARLHEDGSLDTDFGQGGGWILAFDLGQDLTDVARAMAVRDDGRILLVGSVQQATAGDYDMGLAQFLGDLIFADGFESGNLTEWSNVSP